MKQQWVIRVHKSAKRELEDLPDDVEDTLTERIEDLMYEESPTSVGYVRQMDNYDDLWRVRHEDYRAVCQTYDHYIEVLAAGRRQRIYDRIETILDRA